MTDFSFFERVSGIYSLLKSEVVDVQFSRTARSPQVDMKGKVIFMTGATSGKYF